MGCFSTSTARPRPTCPSTCEKVTSTEWMNKRTPWPKTKSFDIGNSSSQVTARRSNSLWPRRSSRRSNWMTYPRMPLSWIALGWGNSRECQMENWLQNPGCALVAFLMHRKMNFQHEAQQLRDSVRDWWCQWRQHTSSTWRLGMCQVPSWRDYLFDKFKKLWGEKASQVHDALSWSCHLQMCGVILEKSALSFGFLKINTIYMGWSAWNQHMDFQMHLLPGNFVFTKNLQPVEDIKAVWMRTCGFSNIQMERSKVSSQHMWTIWQCAQIELSSTSSTRSWATDLVASLNKSLLSTTVDADTLSFPTKVATRSIRKSSQQLSRPLRSATPRIPIACWNLRRWPNSDQYLVVCCGWHLPDLTWFPMWGWSNPESPKQQWPTSCWPIA